MPWWQRIIAGLRELRESTRYSGRLGRVFALRDRGQLEEALRDALALAGEVLDSPSSLHVPTTLAVVATIDELAERLERPEAAYDSLRRALVIVGKEQADLVAALHPRPGDWQSLLERYRREFQDRVNAIVSARNT